MKYFYIDELSGATQPHRKFARPDEGNGAGDEQGPPENSKMFLILVIYSFFSESGNFVIPFKDRKPLTRRCCSKVSCKFDLLSFSARPSASCDSSSRSVSPVPALARQKSGLRVQKSGLTSGKFQD